jgi:hypothetical protein
MPTNRNAACDFRSDWKIATLVGVVLAFMGLFQLTMSIVFAADGAPALLGVVGAVLLVLSAAAFTYRSSVRIDRQTGRALRTRRALIWTQVRDFPLADFQGVGVGMATRSRGGRTSASYFVQLLGPRNLNMPGMSGDRGDVQSAARELGDYLSLPVDEKPRTVFFRWRL